MIYYDKQVINGMNSTRIKQFKINGLFGRRDVCLNLQKEVNIFIGENGLGKTTILNCLYYVLKRNFTRLETINFRSIDVLFKGSDKVYSITKTDLIDYNRSTNKTRKYYIDDYFELMIGELGFTPEDIKHFSLEKLDKLAMILSTQENIPQSIIKQNLLRYGSMAGFKTLGSEKRGDKKKVTELSMAIDKYVDERIIYLPTYRRIENDFSNLNIRTDSALNSEILIRFGMDDVQKSIDEILEKIRKVAMEGYSGMTGILLRQYTTGVDVPRNRIHQIDLHVARIVLDRLGDKIEKETRESILNLINSGQIYDEHYTYLLNLLTKLIDNYDDQKHYDDRINGFVSTCNKYLNDKQFCYDPSNLTLSIRMNNMFSDSDTVELTHLSSGEKQIISLFSKLYLETEDKSIVIIDEPELSLSLSWQQMLLPDIMRSQNCSLLVTVTHSPFIFENEFDMDAREITSCTRRGE